MSNQRKAFERFIESFTDLDNDDPIFYDNENIRFSTLDFPTKISMGSVRAKSLALFMINYSKGFEEISVNKINSEEIDNFEFGYFFSKPQRDNPSENFIPIIEERIVKNNEIIQFPLLTKIKKTSKLFIIIKQRKEESIYYS